jgi:hypothetical protein
VVEFGIAGEIFTEPLKGDRIIASSVPASPAAAVFALIATVCACRR